MSENKQRSALSKPLKRESVVFTVVERIKQALIDREYRPGDFLPSEPELARSLGVSKTTVREAIKMFQAMGVVEVRRGQGTVVCEKPGNDLINPMILQLILHDTDVTDLLNLRVMFEPAYTLMAMQQATNEDRERICATIDSFDAAITENRQSAEDDLAFHLAILESTHNKFVITIGKTILQLFHSSISRSMKVVPGVALENHRRIFDEFCRKDEQKLNEAVLKSFEGWARGLFERGDNNG